MKWVRSQHPAWELIEALGYIFVLSLVFGGLGIEPAIPLAIAFVVGGKLIFRTLKKTERIRDELDKQDSDS